MFPIADKMRTFVELTVLAEKLLQSPIEDSILYDIVFSQDGISGQITTLKLRSLEYYHPDTTYREDVEAYVRALRHRANEYEKALDAIGTPND